MGLQEKIKNFPEAPGVYLMKGKNGEVLYIGKAASLRKRVLSYFQPSRPHPPRIAVLLTQVSDIEYRITRTEAEALLDEAGLIKSKKPKYNVALRDDKSYPWIRLTHEAFPRIFVTRRKVEDGSLYFGPYTDAGLLHTALASMRRNFPLRNCRTFPKKPCLDYYIGQCLAPCVGYIGQKEYNQLVLEAKLFLEGKRHELLQSLSRKMQHFSEERRFEEAATVRDEIQALSGVSLRNQRSGPLAQLEEAQKLLRLKTLPRRIEAFDISNVFGTSACGSMVCFVDGMPYKDGYRRFRIKEVVGIDDYEMMREVIRRRYVRVKRENLEKPDLVIVDGGRGQLSAARGVLKEIGFAEVPAIGIAKRFERIYQSDRSDTIELPKNSKLLHLIQRIRDEAHRFAITYHHLLREKSQGASVLMTIPGLGPRKRQELLCHFKSIDELKQASREKLMEVRGITGKLAERIESALK